MSSEISHQISNMTIRQILRESWTRTYGVKGTMWAGMIIYFIASILILLIGYIGLSYLILGGLTSEIMKYSPDTEIYKSGLEWIRWLILFPMHAGILFLAVRKSMDLPVHFKQIFHAYHFYFRLLIIGILLFCLISLTKVALQVIYGYFQNFPIIFNIVDIFLTLFFSIWLTFASLLVIEKDLNLFSALKLSLIGMKKHWFKITIISLCIILPYFIISNVLIYTPTFMVLGASQTFWIIWGILVTLLVLSSIWIIPMFFNIGGILYRTMFGVNK